MAYEQVQYFLKVLELNRKDLDFNDVKVHIMLDDPSTFRGTMSQVYSAKWIDALKTEYVNLKRKEVLKEVGLPQEIKRFIDSRNVFKRK